VTEATLGNVVHGPPMKLVPISDPGLPRDEHGRPYQVAVELDPSSGAPTGFVLDESGHVQARPMTAEGRFASRREGLRAVPLEIEAAARQRRDAGRL
jgi:hypothetical protein